MMHSFHRVYETSLPARQTRSEFPISFYQVMLNCGAFDNFGAGCDGVLQPMFLEHCFSRSMSRVVFIRWLH